ncbi:hypothetical protein [Oceanobacillus indicireducens]|uniref:Uncharacterized protein n=1 Tax=Oceanobacillus indicireducens TaxID=1004261 RepID=A0A917XYX2_9BACI|nr:hypothetical protein [Oceanobacillus indicireducens]GGN59532.1 hypothetical protein GCM10007971_22730 [Oceanobacillus indicireducens]
MEEQKEKSPKVAPTTNEDNLVVNKMMFNVLEKKLDSLLLADKYHRIFHTAYILLLLILILFQ